jgi:hypothetical protein
MWEVMSVVIVMKWMEGGKPGGFIAPVLYMEGMWQVVGKCPPPSMPTGMASQGCGSSFKTIIKVGGDGMHVFPTIL